ncbi:MAG TPA: CBS domain-containing protein [Anaerolineales bacterium]
MLKTVKQILEEKGQEIWSVSPDDNVYDALKKMAEKNIGALLVLEGEDLVGIISERDYARKVMLRGKSSMDTPVKDVMTPRVLYVRINQPIEDCMALMTDKRIRHLPVFDEDKLVGVISIGDVVKAIISHQEFVIEQLENYITVGR